ncbi:MAG: response regulator transcription factor [Flavobacterium sp.]
MNPKKATLIIADDHPLLLKGMYDEFMQNGYNIIGQATNGPDALQLILDHQPDIAFLDIDMPVLTGLEVVKMAKNKDSKTKFIILSFHKHEGYITQSKTLQIDGYLLKENSFEELERSIEVVMSGKQYFSSSFNNLMIENGLSFKNKIKVLSPSEITILKLIAKLQSNQEISKTLFVSERTIEKHRSNIIKKLDLPKGNNSLTNWVLTNKEIILIL